jgi:hypothetical protein
MAGLQHIQEGFAYHDGETTALYDPSDRRSAEAVLLQQCVSYDFGPLTIKACLDTSVPSVSVTVTLLGTTIGSCTLSPSSPGCTIGGSIDGFKAEITLALETDPWALQISGQVCAPIAGCKSFSVTVPFGSLEDA